MIILLLIYAAISAASLWPLPQDYSIGQQVTAVSPCQVNFKVSLFPQHVSEIVQFYRTKIFKCPNSTKFAVDLNVSITNSSLIAPLKGLQNFTINLTQSQWSIRSTHYPGFVRGLETLSQLFYQSKNNMVINLPALINDSPDLQYRGVMIDTSRHFLSPEFIQHTIDSLMFNKMNVLHIHLIDDDSFPIFIPSNPNISTYGSFNNKTYSQSAIQSIVQYGLLRAVRVIPEIDSPAHTHAWGRSLNKTDFVITCRQPYQGQFDPTVNKTYQWMSQVASYVNSAFKDDYIHLGGDQVQTDCWNQRPSIRQFMTVNNIGSYQALQVYYRQRQKKQIRKFTNKTLMYWSNQGINLPTQADDVIHWWGSSNNFQAGIGNRTNKVVVSFVNLLYIDIGFGSNTGNTYGTSIQQWLPIYQAKFKFPEIKADVIGAVTTIWGQVTDEFTDDVRIWPRTSALAERLWNSYTFHPGYNFDSTVSRLSGHIRRLQSRGVRAMPIRNELCERKGILC